MYLVESPQQVADLNVNNPQNLAFVTQTTLSMDDASAIIAALKARFPLITGPKKDDICYATQNRQDAVKMLVKQCDVVIVVGSPNSSNSNRLREVAANVGVAAYLVDDASGLQPEWFVGKAHVGITAGASAPEVLVQGVLKRLQQLGAQHVTELQASSRTWCSRCPRHSLNPEKHLSADCAD